MSQKVKTKNKDIFESMQVTGSMYNHYNDKNSTFPLL